MPLSSRRLDRWTRQLRLTQRDRILTAKPAFRVSDVPVQGTIVITQKYVCFCPTLQGLSPALRITYSDLISVCKEKVFSLFPTGIRITTAKTTMIFSNIGSRDKLLQHLNSAWEAWKMQPCGTPSPSISATPPAAFRRRSRLSLERRSSRNSGVAAATSAAAATAAAAAVAAAEIEDAGDDPSDSGIETSPSPPPLIARTERAPLPPAPPAVGTSPAPVPPDGAQASRKLMQTCSAFSVQLEWLAGSGILAGVLLAFCTVIAIWLSIRTVSLQRQIIALTEEQLLLSSQAEAEPQSQIVTRSALCTALEDLTLLTSRLSELSRSLSEATSRKEQVIG